MKTIDDIKRQFTDDIGKAANTTEVEELKIRYLGRKGPIQDLMKGLKEATNEDRPILGKAINELKVTISAELEEKLTVLVNLEEKVQLEQEKIDVSLPGRRRSQGGAHILSSTLKNMCDILVGMGFSVQYGPDIDSDYYNFEVLNFPDDHPARDMQDTYYLSDHMLLRTHTSNIQARVMEGTKPPIRVIAPGKVYRNETITARSHVFFHQVEALYIDKGVTFADLLSTLDEFLEKVFGCSVKTRYRPSFFPFVEPGMEVDISCLSCGGSGCTICKQTGWLEIAGAGMVHPEVLKNGGIDPEIYTGFAWGLGVERIAMLKHGIKDIRIFTENHEKFLKQFT